MRGGSGVSDVEWLVNTDEVRVRINTLQPGQGTAWHHHSVVTDDVLAMDGRVEVELRDPTGTVVLMPGEHHRTPAGRVHRVLNRGEGPVRYLLIQATGQYDFVED